MPSPDGQQDGAQPTSPSKQREELSSGGDRPSVSEAQNDEYTIERSPPASEADDDIEVTNAEEPTTPTAAEAPIPRLRSIAPAIFVPISKLFPSEDALRESAQLEKTDRVEHMRQSLSRGDKHAAAVRGNMLALFRRESARIMQDMRREEPEFLAESGLDRESYRCQLREQHGWSASPRDLDQMIANMAAAAPTASARKATPSVAEILRGQTKDTYVTDDVIKSAPEPSFSHRSVATPRELAARECLVLINKATHEFRSYDTHIAAKRNMRKMALDKGSGIRRERAAG